VVGLFSLSLSLLPALCLSRLPPRAPPLRKSTPSRSYAPSWVFRVTYEPTHDADGCTGGPALEVPGVALALALRARSSSLQPSGSRWPTPYLPRRGVSKHLRPVAPRKFSARLSAKRVSIRESQGAHDHENAFTRPRACPIMDREAPRTLSICLRLRLSLIYSTLTLLLMPQALIMSDAGEIRVKRKNGKYVLIIRHTLLSAYR